MFFLNITKNNILTLDYQIKLMFYLTLIRFIFTNKVWNFKNRTVVQFIKFTHLRKFVVYSKFQIFRQS